MDHTLKHRFFWFSAAILGENFVAGIPPDNRILKRSKLAQK
jgi:hypothetical protein